MNHYRFLSKLRSGEKLDHNWVRKSAKLQKVWTLDASSIIQLSSVVFHVWKNVSILDIFLIKLLRAVDGPVVLGRNAVALAQAKVGPLDKAAVGPDELPVVAHVVEDVLQRPVLVQEGVVAGPPAVLGQPDLGRENVDANWLTKINGHHQSWVLAIFVTFYQMKNTMLFFVSLWIEFDWSRYSLICPGPETSYYYSEIGLKNFFVYYIPEPQPPLPSSGHHHWLMRTISSNRGTRDKWRIRHGHVLSTINNFL